MAKTKPAQQARLEQQARIALRAALKREPTAEELRYLRLGDGALGDDQLLRLRTENAAKNNQELRRTRRELIAKLRQTRARAQKLRARASPPK